MSVEVGRFVPHTLRMTTPNEEERFNNDLCARVARLREQRGWTQDRMATMLGIPLWRYQKYEYRSPMPQYLLPRFAEFVERSVEYVLTGQDSVPVAAPKSRITRRKT